MSDLFDRLGFDTDSPLAYRARPVSPADVVGQDHLFGPDGFLTVALERGSLPSMILWGPPGSGKSTIAQVAARASGGAFVFFSAVAGSVKEIREIIAAASENRRFHRRRTCLFVDEIHHFNRSQQDAFLPSVEDGTIRLIAATTGNPSFYCNAALLSRCRVFTLNRLEAPHLRRIVERAVPLLDPPAALEEGVAGRIALLGDGDARKALSLLESAAAMAAHRRSPVIAATDLDSVVGSQALLYDRKGEEHYNLVSAFIKSLRGSDPDAAVYWLMRMLASGEDPLFILRRMAIFASEDVGNADPRALSVAVAALESFRFIGMPEGIYPLSQAALYLACAPKSNAGLKAFAAANEDVREFGSLEVPLHLRNAVTDLMKALEYGRGYRYPHDFDGGHVDERYLPDQLAGRRYYRPVNRGWEARIRDYLERIGRPVPEE